MISIICPTRNRPNNVIRLVKSALNLKSASGKVEFLFFVDSDDKSFPSALLETHNESIKIVTGPRQWISNAHNTLYSHAQGEFLMTAGDDMVFETQNWDQIIKENFELYPDKIVLLFGDDKATHSGKIAIHGFFHQHWVHVLGTWVQPGRGSLWDLWTTENARKLGRLRFLPNLVIPHIHYRQGEKNAEFDSTYQNIYNSNSEFRPELTYKKLYRERRIDRILLGEAMSVPPPMEGSYWLAEKLCKLPFNSNRHRLLSMRNSDLILTLLRKLFKYKKG